MVGISSDSESENLGPLSDILFNLLIHAGKEFTGRLAVDQLVRQDVPEAGLARKTLVFGHLASLAWAVDAQQKSHLFL